MGHGNRVRAYLSPARPRGTDAAQQPAFGPVQPARPGRPLRVSRLRRRAPASRGAAPRGRIGGRVDEIGPDQHAVDPASPPYGGGVPRALKKTARAPPP